MATNNATNTSNPITVGQGGTGKASLTAYAVLCGGTTTTGSIQSIAALGSSGNVLTSNGAGALPTFQAAAGGGITTLNGNSGSATGSTVTLTTGTLNTQGTAVFTGSSATVTLKFSDTNNNVGLGGATLNSSTLSGSNNTCMGVGSGTSITSGGSNTCFGRSAGNSIMTGSNSTFIGWSAGSSYTNAESSNICIGYNVIGTNATSHELRIGNGTGSSTAGNVNSCFISGITGITVTGTAVLVSSSNQLGIAVSSSRFKNEIREMGASSSVIHQLRPVTFNWNRNSAPGLADAPEERQFGLIAEEVAEVIPQVVSFDKDGRALSVNYSDLSSLLVNEMQKIQRYCESLEERIIELENYLEI